MPAIRVYDPAMCCSTGVCGPDADDELAQFAAALDRAKKNGIVVDRYTLAHQPGEYVSNTQVKSLLDSDGVDCLPMVFVDDNLVKKGGYPTRSQLLGLLGLDTDAAPSEPAASNCCAPKEKAASSSCCG
jgi:hypothetical protein